jgi:VWFA-related protein
MTLAPAQTCSLTVRFSPTTTAHLGIVNGTLRINSNDPNASTVDVSLGGTGYGLNVWINKIVTAQCEANVDVTVTDPTNNNILALTQSNFTLSENGQQVQSFTASQIAYPAPVTLLLALDWSESTINVRPQLKAGAESFINLFSSQDLAGICKFASTVEFYPNPLPPFIAADASGKTSLNSYIYGDPSIGLNTSLYEAVYQSIDKVAQETGKRVVIVLSDGHEVSSGTYTLAQVIASAKSNGIPIFTIYYNDPQYQGGNYGKPEIMQQLANETGGQYYNAPTGADFASIFQQIANVLSNKYTLTYTSSMCPGTVSLDVRAELNGLYGQDSRAISF